MHLFPSLFANFRFRHSDVVWWVSECIVVSSLQYEIHLIAHNDLCRPTNHNISSSIAFNLLQSIRAYNVCEVFLHFLRFVKCPRRIEPFFWCFFLWDLISHLCTFYHSAPSLFSITLLISTQSWRRRYHPIVVINLIILRRRWRWRKEEGDNAKNSMAYSIQL